MTNTKITRKQKIQIFLHPSKKLGYVSQAKMPLTENVFVPLFPPEIMHNNVKSAQSSEMLLVAFEEFLTEDELSDAFDFYNEWFEIPEKVEFESTIKQLAKLNTPRYDNVFYPDLLRENLVKNAMFSILTYISTLIQQQHNNKFKY